jgi:hypothetical protein
MIESTDLSLQDRNCYPNLLTLVISSYIIQINYQIKEVNLSPDGKEIIPFQASG